MVFGSPRQSDSGPMQSLDSMPKGWAVPLREDIRTDLDNVIRADTEEETIKSPMVQMA